jgi:hypothetical protein
VPKDRLAVAFHVIVEPNARPGLWFGDTLLDSEDSGSNKCDAARRALPSNYQARQSYAYLRLHILVAEDNGADGTSSGDVSAPAPFRRHIVGLPFFDINLSLANWSVGLVARTIQLQRDTASAVISSLGLSMGDGLLRNPLTHMADGVRGIAKRSSGRSNRDHGRIPLSGTGGK